MANVKLAAQIADDLGLDLPPVALAFRDAAPKGVAVTDDIVPSACAFWRKAETGVFFASVARHANCPIGAFVMGFELGDTLMAELQSLIGQMTACGYVHRDEPAKIPVNRRKAAGILYGPLAQFPAEPDVVLVWLTPPQAMIWSEATGGAAWTGSPPTNVFGRPACAAIPAALDKGGPSPRRSGFGRAGGPALSLGCMGMRTFTAIPADRMLAVIPGPRLADFAKAIAETTGVNRAMRRFYEDRLAVLGAKG
jgi:uncharacterized protein (DUF169 family)